MKEDSRRSALMSQQLSSKPVFSLVFVLWLLGLGYVVYYLHPAISEIRQVAQEREDFVKKHGDPTEDFVDAMEFADMGFVDGVDSAFASMDEKMLAMRDFQNRIEKHARTVQFNLAV